MINERFLTYPDSVASYLDFPDWTRFLGAAEMYDLTNNPASERAMLSWSYDSMVPCYRLVDGHRDLVKTTGKRQGPIPKGMDSAAWFLIQASSPMQQMVCGHAEEF